MGSTSRINTALASYESLSAVIVDLTEEEVLAALELESTTRRRKAIMCRLLRRAVRLNELKYKSTLVRRYLNGETRLCSDG